MQQKMISQLCAPRPALPKEAAKSAAKEWVSSSPPRVRPRLLSLLSFGQLGRNKVDF